MATIGEPKREIYVEPLELPEPLRAPAPAITERPSVPAREPEKVPA